MAGTQEAESGGVKSRPNKQKLMETRAGVLPKPMPRKRKKGSKSGASHLIPVDPNIKRDRTTWMSIKDLFSR